MGRAPGHGHNGGPPIKEPRHRAPWGSGDPYRYCQWKKAHQAAWRVASADIGRFRAGKAEALGLTDREYQLEILERGRHLQAEDADLIAAIKARRKVRRRPLPD